MPDQNEALINQLMQRNQIMAGTTGQQQPVQMPISLPVPQQVEPPRLQMSPAERELFMRQTGIKSNPSARDINLPVSLEELMKRANALMSAYSGKQ